MCSVSRGTLQCVHMCHICQTRCQWQAAISFIRDWHQQRGRMPQGGMRVMSVCRYVSLCIHSGMRTALAVSFPARRLHSFLWISLRLKYLPPIDVSFPILLLFSRCCRYYVTTQFRCGGGGGSGGYCGSNCGGGYTFNRIMNSRNDMRW